MRVEYKSELNELIDEYMEVGYMAEPIEVSTIDGNFLTIADQKSDRTLQLLASFPNESEFEADIIEFDKFFDDLKIELKLYMIFAQSSEYIEQLAKKLNHFEVVIDREGEYGQMYGTVYVSGALTAQLTKAIFLIGKDGAIYLDDMPSSLETSFKLELLVSELNKAYAAYTGVGCHG